MKVRLLYKLREAFHPLHRLRRIGIVDRTILRSLDKETFVEIAGVRWPVCVRRIRHLSYIADARIVEPGVLSFVYAVQALVEPRVFWDVGANFGFYSWIVMSSGNNVETVLFEPDQENISLLEKTIAKGELLNAHLVQRAVSEKIGIARFVLDESTGLTSHLEEGGRGGSGRIMEVRTTTLDHELRCNPKPGFVKIDVEGAEGMVLAGARELLNEVRPVIMLETFSGVDSAPLRELRTAGYVVLGADNPADAEMKSNNYLAWPDNASVALNEIQERACAEYQRLGAG